MTDREPMRHRSGIARAIAVVMEIRHVLCPVDFSDCSRSLDYPISSPVVRLATVLHGHHVSVPSRGVRRPRAGPCGGGVLDELEAMQRRIAERAQKVFRERGDALACEEG
jgi:hypothetical protein